MNKISTCGAWITRSLCAMLICATAFTPAQSMSVTPIVLELIASGPLSKSRLRVLNDGATPLAVEFKISRLELDESGQGQATSAGEDFNVFPPQALIAPGSSQTFGVQWTGRGALDKSRTYIFSVNQLPVKLPKTQSGMQLVFNFAVVVNVAPIEGTSTLDVKSVVIVKDSTGARRAQLTVANSGNKHASLGDASILLSGGKWSQTLTGAALRQMLGVALVQPGKQRRFVLTTDLPPQINDLSARIDYRQLATSSNVQ